MSAVRYEVTQRDEANRLRAALTQAEIARSVLVLEKATANRKRIDAENTLRFVLMRIDGFLKVAPGPGRDVAERELREDLTKAQKALGNG